MLPLRQRVPLVLARLEQHYPDPRCGLDFTGPFDLAVATILSAQCTDKRVNLVTPGLFARFPTPQAFAAARLSDIEQVVKPTGFFRMKAKSIQGFSRAIIERHDGRVPDTLDELVELPGIGRKTANVVLGDAFGVPGITVDTHVGRLSRRLGWTAHTDPVKVEFALMKLWPKPTWTDTSHRVILHGRAICFARKPQCEVCPLADLCPKRGVASPKVPGRKSKPADA
jgi:endonuclease-3